MEDIITYLQIFYRSVFLPIHYYRQDECVLTLPAVQPEFDLAHAFQKALLEKNTILDYIVRDEYIHYGIVRNFETDEYIIIGPVITARVQPKRIPHILKQASIPFSYKDQIGSLLKTIPLFSFDQFVNLMVMLYKELSHKLIDPFAYFQKVSTDSIYQISKEHNEAAYQAREDENYHNTYELELELGHYVESGDVEGLKRMMKRMPQVRAGTTSENSLRQEKNMIIASTTLITRSAITGGLDIETAYQLSDTYIQKAEKAQTINEIRLLSQTIITDFTRRVAACKVPNGISQDVFRCIQYVSSHLNQPLSVDDVTNATGKSRTHISRQFKKEIGCSISDFVMHRKLEESMALLTYTDKSIGEISEYLCFSTQSYFQNVFKKKYGITPNEYRKKNKR